MFVERLLPTAREKLVTIADDAPLVEAAKLLRTGTGLVVVCGSSGLLAGVITRTDIVSQVSRCQGAGCIMPASSAMTRAVVFCRPGDLLHDDRCAVEAGLRSIVYRLVLVQTFDRKLQLV